MLLDAVFEVEIFRRVKDKHMCRYPRVHPVGLHPRDFVMLASIADGTARHILRLMTQRQQRRVNPTVLPVDLELRHTGNLRVVVKFH